MLQTGKMFCLHLVERLEGFEPWVKMKVLVLSHVRLFATAWTVAHQAPLSMEFSRQEY